MNHFAEKQKRMLIIFIMIFLFGMLISCSNTSQTVKALPTSSVRVVMDNNYPSYLTTAIIITLVIIIVLIVFARTLQKRVSESTHKLKQALSSLQKSERKYREIFNATTEAIFIHAIPSGQLLHVNKSMLQMYGYATEEEALCKNIDDLSANESPYSSLDIREKLQKAMEEGPQVFEWLAKRKTGEFFWTEVSLQKSQLGGEDQLLAVVRDITGRKQASAALLKSEEQYRALFDGMMDGIYRSTHDGNFVDINPAMVKIFGYSSREEMLAVDIKKDLYFAPEDRGSHIIDTGQEEVEVYRMKRKDGSEIWVEDRGYYVHDERGNILYHEGMLRDITARKQAEEALRENESLLSITAQG
jgi:PAS domain S-box-containing protein